MNETLQWLKTAFAAGLVLAMAACGGGIGGTGSPQSGTLRIGLTDAPACGYDEVNVAIRAVQVHQVASAGETDAGWRTVVDFADAPRRFDLLKLTNGVIAELGQAELPAGTYTQLRLLLAQNTPGNPLANSVKPTGGSERPLDTPSGQQTGLKLNVDITVPEGQLADVVLDFDACRSVVRAGNSGKFLLKPVIAVLPRLSDAGLRVIGFVDPAIASGSTSVSVQQGGRVIRATPPVTSGSGQEGRFELNLLPPGAYDLVVTAPGRATAVITGVPVQAATPTLVGSATVRIAPPTSAERTIDGAVALTPPVTDNLSTVRILQALAGGRTVEVAGRPVNAADGSFGFSLPIAAPQRAAYAASPASITLTADAPAAGLYRAEATAPGFATVKEQDVNLNLPAVPPLSFAFP
jgi:hypothetical protein